MMHVLETEDVDFSDWRSFMDISFVPFNHTVKLLDRVDLIVCIGIIK